MEMNCPHSVLKMLSEVLATHNAACAEKINNFISKIASSTALIAEFTAKASILSADEVAHIHDLASMYGTNSDLEARITSVIVDFKKAAFTPMISEAASAAADAEKMKADYDAKCEAFPNIVKDVDAFKQELKDMYTAAQNKAAALQAMTGEAVAAFNSLEAPAVVVVETPIAVETPEVVAEAPAVIDTPVETVVVVEEVPAAPVEEPAVVIETPVTVTAPEVVAEPVVVVEAPADAPVVVDVPATPVEEMPVAVEEPTVVVEAPAAEVMDGDFLGGNTPTLVDATLEA
jgi:hypothetical protein